MNAETTETITPPWGDATFSARVMLEMLKIISEDASACAAMAREAVSLSAIPESGYERALSVYMGLLGITGKVHAMLGEAKRLHGTMRQLDGMNRPDIADVKKKEPLATEAKSLERAAKNLSGINRDMLAVRRSDATPAEKREKLDALTVERNALLKAVVTESKDAQKAGK